MWDAAFAEVLVVQQRSIAKLLASAEALSAAAYEEHRVCYQRSAAAAEAEEKTGTPPRARAHTRPRPPHRPPASASVKTLRSFIPIRTSSTAPALGVVRSASATRLSATSRRRVALKGCGECGEGRPCAGCSGAARGAATHTVSPP